MFYRTCLEWHAGEYDRLRVDVVRNCHPQLLVCTSNVPAAQPAHQGGEEGTTTQTQLSDKSTLNIVKLVLRTRKEMSWMVWTLTVYKSHTLSNVLFCSVHSRLARVGQPIALSTMQAIELLFLPKFL